ncbi:prolipoprotein diacylglyceryl transferase [Spiroplasma chinense]|uniref:Prolipoprotein diacylglyceryl transferase n=1 Tax=Spiroplasma chinense TaxID=216932 RepID=A0A5B9Y2X1_9MOLU|nr:prolipoprotein diacylglyceryl transferase family protein [Spiroplasma chinense]QEH61301.1 prolipoprotein diacylglyceryl transferase [Spiroplasma chinense]
MNNFLTDNPYWEAQTDSLSFMYSILMFIGVLAVIIASTVKLVIKKVPLKDFMNSIYIIIPTGVMGGSIFGKLGTGVPIYQIFYIWEPGMSIFGALVCGVTGGFAWLYSRRTVTKISMWVYADAMLPNVLLGQSIGRWGNLFNHEILGKDTDITKWQWLPDWVWQRFFYFYNPETGEAYTSIVYKQPLFLIESMLTLTSWVLITFVIANLGKWFSKKPWKVNPNKYPVKIALPFEDIITSETYVELKYKKLTNQNGVEVYKFSKQQAWLKAYFAYEAPVKEAELLQNKIDTHKGMWLMDVEKRKNIKFKLNNEIEKLKLRLKNNKISKEEYKLKVKELKKEAKTELKPIKASSFKNFMTLDSKELYKLNNPENYFVIHSGVLASCYVIIYSIIRIILDSFRTRYELAFKWHPALNYMSLTGILILGILLLVCAQFVAPKKWREEGWLYEKSY